MTSVHHGLSFASARSSIWTPLALLCLLMAAPHNAHADVASELNAAARQHLAGGFESALAHWDQARRDAQAAGDANAEARAQLGAARTYLALGRAPLATQRLESAHKLATAPGNQALLGPISAALGSALLLAGEPAKARVALEQAITLGRNGSDQDVIAQSANDLARLEAEAGNTALAADLYRQGMASARVSGNPALAATAAVNLARLPLPAGDRLQALTSAQQLVRALPPSHIRAMTLVSVGRLRGETPDPAGAPGASRRQACAGVGLSVRTAERWAKRPEGSDLRAGPKTSPAHALSPAERAHIVELATSPQYRNLSVRQLVPRLAVDWSDVKRLGHSYALRCRLVVACSF